MTCINPQTFLYARTYIRKIIIIFWYHRSAKIQICQYYKTFPLYGYTVNCFSCYIFQYIAIFNFFNVIDPKFLSATRTGPIHTKWILNFDTIGPKSLSAMTYICQKKVMFVVMIRILPAYSYIIFL